MIFAPDDKRVVENTAVHADGTVNLGIHDGVGADDHAIGQVVVFTAFRNCARQAQVIGIELRKVGGKRHLAGTDLAGFVLYDRVHRDAVIVQQLAPNRESIKLLDPAGSLADTPAEKHIEFQPRLRLNRTSGVTSSVLKKVTMGFGAFIQSAYASARVVVLGSITVGFILHTPMHDPPLISLNQFYKPASARNFLSD